LPAARGAAGRCGRVVAHPGPWLPGGGRFLTLHGRIDDCVRTRENRLVNLAAVATAIREIPGVTDAVVVPLERRAGARSGAVVQCAPDLARTVLRTPLADVLPPWSWPRVVEMVRALPRLSNGKTDRRACITLLSGRDTG